MAQLAYEIAKQRIAKYNWDAVVDLSGLWDLEEVPELPTYRSWLDVSNTSVHTLSPSLMKNIRTLWCYNTNITSLPHRSLLRRITEPCNIALICEYWRFKEIHKNYNGVYTPYEWHCSFYWKFESTDSDFQEWYRKLVTKLDVIKNWKYSDVEFSVINRHAFFSDVKDVAWPSWHKTWLIKEELMSVAWHTDRVEAWCGEAWDVDASS